MTLRQKNATAEKILWATSIFLTLVGVVDSMYLTYVKIGRSTPAFCAPGGGCDVVNASPYSEIAGIPIAILGGGAYLALLFLLLLETSKPELQYSSLLTQFGINLVGVLYSAYLTYLELFVIHAICPYCVVSAICMGILLIISSIRLVKYPTFEESFE
jgi:uncharacterized membrane protein